MPVPKEILAVERPTKTVVYVTSAGNYGVKKRVGCRYVNGRNVPVNGPTVDHIIGGKYVPNLVFCTPKRNLFFINA